MIRFTHLGWSCKESDESSESFELLSLFTNKSFNEFFNLRKKEVKVINNYKISYSI